jgi:hypothetical protein
LPPFIIKDNNLIKIYSLIIVRDYIRSTSGLDLLQEETCIFSSSRKKWDKSYSAQAIISLKEYTIRGAKNSLFFPEFSHLFLSQNEALDLTSKDAIRNLLR